MDTFGWPISDVHEDNRLVSYIFVNGLPESRLFKITFPESRFVKSPNPVSRSKLQSRISLPFSSKIPNPGLQISQISDPEKPIGDPPFARARIFLQVLACYVFSGDIFSLNTCCSLGLLLSMLVLTKKNAVLACSKRTFDTPTVKYTKQKFLRHFNIAVKVV